MSIMLMILLILKSLFMAIIDSSMGAMYGTLISPILIFIGYSPRVVIPGVLLSQACSGLSASIFHHKNGNVSFNKDSDDLKMAILISIVGVVAVSIAAIIATSIPVSLLSICIGIIITIIGIIILSGIEFKFSWKAVLTLATLSAFIKGLTGGGYGPLITSGQIVLGKNSKNSVGVKSFSSIFVCLAGFLTFLIAHGIEDWFFILYLCLGASIGGMIGPFLTTKIFKNDRDLRLVMGVLVLILGTLLLLKLKT